jgi:hypothetical protein
LPPDDLLLQLSLDPSRAREVAFVVQLEKLRLPGSLIIQLRVTSLCQVNDASVVAEVRLLQLRASIQTQTFTNYPVKMSHQKIRQVERTRLRLSQFTEAIFARE